MKISQLKNVIKESVKEAIQEEMKEILLEAVRSPQPTVYENKTTHTPVKTNNPKPMSIEDKMAVRENMMGVLGSMMPNANGTLTATSNDVPLQVTGTMDTSSPNGALPQGSVSVDQIMNFIKK